MDFQLSFLVERCIPLIKSGRTGRGQGTRRDKVVCRTGGLLAFHGRVLALRVQCLELSPPSPNQ